MKPGARAVSACLLSMLLILALPLSCRAEETPDTALNALIQEAMASDGAFAENCAVKLGAAFLSDPRSFVQTLSGWDEVTREEIAGMVVYDQNGPHNPDFQLAVTRLSGDSSLTDAESAVVTLMQSLCAPATAEAGAEAAVTSSIETAPVFSAAIAPRTDRRPLYWAIGLALFGVLFAIFAFKGIRKL